METTTTENQGGLGVNTPTLPPPIKDKCITPNCVTDIIFGYMGRLAKVYLERYWCDMAMDVRQLDRAVEAMTKDVQKDGYERTKCFTWICRDHGTHLVDYDDPACFELLDAARKTFGDDNCKVFIQMTAKPDTNDATKVSFSTTFEFKHLPSAGGNN